MSCCNCGQPKKLCRCPQKGEAPKRAYIAECTDCDPCRPCESMVKICSFVAPTLTEGQRFRNSFVYNQEDDSVYYIDDSGTPTRFGSSPMFIDNFNPDDRAIPRQTVFDFVNNKAYIYDPEGNYITVGLSGEAKAKALHVYLPEDADLYPSDNNYVTLANGPWYEKPDVTIKDENGDTLSPETMLHAIGDVVGAPVIVHVPELSFSWGGATLTVSAGEYIYLVTLATGDAIMRNPDMDAVVIAAGSGEFSVQISVAAQFEAGYNTKITIPVSLPE